jgi:hypothetical protein
VAVEVVELRLEDRGTHELWGVPGDWRLYAVAREQRPKAAP